MTKILYQSLETKVKQIIYFHEVDDFFSEINFLLEEQKLTQSEYESLLIIAKKQLKLTLDLNLLPSDKHISLNLTEKFPQTLVKLDPGEIIAAEFEIIEQEAMNLNLAKVKYIQDNFMQRVSVAAPITPKQDVKRKPRRSLFKYINYVTNLVKSFFK